MPSSQDTPRRRGIRLPPSGWVLAILLLVYLFIGLVGHDPWKHDDATSIGIAYDIVVNGHWLAPQLAGHPYPDAPLYYWVGAISAQLFSWLLPFHDAARLASALFTILALEFILLAARELNGRENAAAAPLLLAGSIGFLYHAHEAQPMLAALTAHTAAYWALVQMPRRPRFSALVFGAALATGFLANGGLPVLTLLPVGAFALWCDEEWRKRTPLFVLALVFALSIVALWLFPLRVEQPLYFADFLTEELSGWASLDASGRNILRYLGLLPWYAWPALPLAAWSLWAKRRSLRARPLALPLFSFLMTLAILGLSAEARSSAALLLLPPLVLLAVPGVASLRRGAMNAFDWFAMTSFTLFAGLVWTGWCAMVFGWPERLARQIVRLEPGFAGRFDLLAGLFALLATASWFWLIATSPRSPLRGIMHWMAGLTLFWLLLAMLWMPWIDYGKSYRPLAAQLAGALPAKTECLANANVPDSILASLNYFEGIRAVPQKSAAAKRCSVLLILGEVRDPDSLLTAGWRPIWEGKRPGDRRESDKFHLYRRGKKATSASALPELKVDAPDPNPLPKL